MSKYPEPTVGLFIRNRKEEILLVKSPKWKNEVWTVPGGHIEIGETIEKTAKREALEEVGVKIEKIRLFATWEAIFSKQFYKKKHFIFLQCECLIKEGEKVKIDNREITESAWFSLKKALKQNLERYTRKAIEVLVRGK